MRDFFRIIVRGYGWRIGAILAVLTMAIIESWFFS